MTNRFHYTFYNGAEVKEMQPMIDKMNSICCEYKGLKESDILRFLEESSTICCMTQNNELMGFSWTVLCEEEQIAELCWLVMGKKKSKGLDGKYLLDKTLDYCKSKNINSVKFNCDLDSWGRIKNKSKL